MSVRGDNPIPRIIAEASDENVLIGLVMRGATSLPMADGSVRLMIRLRPESMPKPRPVKPRKVAIHPDVALSSQKKSIHPDAVLNIHKPKGGRKKKQ